MPRFKRGEDGSKSVSPQPATVLNSSNLSSTSRQRYNSRATKNRLSSQHFFDLFRLKRSASGSALDDEPFPKTSASSLDSPVCRENPSLVNLLVKPLPIAVPPPVPTKWHQVYTLPFTDRLHKAVANSYFFRNRKKSFQKTQ